MGTVYYINKGINKPITFKGLKSQYIAYLAVGLVVLLIGFAVLYICGLSLYVILPVIGGSGTALSVTVMRLSRRFGEHGLSKYFAKKQLPRCIRFRSRRIFIHLANKAQRPLEHHLKTNNYAKKSA
jgi:hypothetical protein